MKRSSQIALFTLMVCLGQAARGSASRGENLSQEDLRAGLLASVVLETEGLPSGKAGDLVKVQGKDVDSFVDSLGEGLPHIDRTRIFYSGNLVAEKDQLALDIQRQQGLFNRATGSLFVVGSLGEMTTIEDMRTLELGGRLYVLRDVYLDGERANLSAGRGLPVLLESASAAASVSPPQVLSISGFTSSVAGVSNGRVAMTCGTTWNGGLAVNDQAVTYTWTIAGANFGTTTGTVSVGGRVASIGSWSSTRISATPTVPTNYGPATTFLTITASSGRTDYAVSIVPAIRTRIYGQCTWFVALTRLALGLQPSPTAYGGYSNITAQWAPQRGDQLAWNGTHTAIITAVSGPSVVAGIKIYTLTVEEYNADCRNGYHSYSTNFQVRTINGQSTVVSYPKSSVATLGNATVYFR